MRDAADIEQAMARHGDTVWRACLVVLKSRDDVQDAFQDTYMKYALADDVAFNDDEHRKAWLIRVATNTSRDQLRAAARKNVSLEEGAVETFASSDANLRPDSRVREVLEAMNNLDDPPRMPVYLALYEGYTAPEIASMLNAPVNTVYSWIARGKRALKEALQ